MGQKVFEDKILSDKDNKILESEIDLSNFKIGKYILKAVTANQTFIKSIVKFWFELAIFYL